MRVEVIKLVKKTFAEGVLRFMSRIFLHTSLLIIAFIALSNSHAVDIEGVIPAHSLGYVAVRDIPGIWDGVKESPFWQAFLSSSELGDGIREIEMGVGLMKQSLGVDLRVLLEVFCRRLALVQIYADAGSVMPIFQDAPPIVIADVGAPEMAPEIISKVEQLLQGNESYEIRPQAGKYLSVTFGTFRSAGGDPTLIYAFLDRLFVIAWEQDDFEAIVDAYLGEAPSLLQDPKFNKVSAKVATDNEVIIYANMEALWSTGMWRAEPGVIMQMLGVRDIRSILWTTNLLDPVRDQEMYMYTGDSDGLLISLFAEPKTLYSPDLIPAVNADIFFTVHFGDLKTAWENLKNSIRITLGQENYAQMERGISEFEHDTGLSLEDDILSSLTGEVGFALTFPELVKPLRGPEFLLQDGFMIFCGVKDRERCATSIQRILSAARAELQQTEYKGVTVYQIPAPDSSEYPHGYTFAGDMLVFGSFQKLEALIDEAYPLAASEGFAGIASQLPQQMGLLYCVNMEKMQELMLRAMPEIQDDMTSETPGSIGGTMNYDGEGLKFRSIGTPGKSWLETIGGLMDFLLVRKRVLGGT